jgi:hypothetical protein
MGRDNTPPENDRYYKVSNQCTVLKAENALIRSELHSHRSDIKSLEGRISAVEKDVAVIESKGPAEHTCNKISNITEAIQTARSLAERVNALRSDFGAFVAEVTQKFKALGLRWSVATGVLTILIIPTLSASWYLIDKAHQQQTTVILNSTKLAQHETAIKTTGERVSDLQIESVTESNQIDVLVDRILDKMHKHQTKHLVNDHKLKEKLTLREQRRLMELLGKAGY